MPDIRATRRWPRRSVGLKFASVIGVASALVLAVAISLVMRNVRDQDARQAERAARASAERLSAAVQRTFEDAFAIVGETHEGIVAMRDADVADPLVYDTLLRRMVDADRFGAWLEWDRGEAPAGPAFAARLDARSRFATYLHQNGMEMIREAIPDEVYASDLYRVPRQEGLAYLLAPHRIDAANGDPTLVTSFSRPLQRNGRVVGVLALDVKLDAIASAISALDMPKGTALAIVSEDGTVAGASDPSWVGKPLAKKGPAFARLLSRAKVADGAEALARDGAPVLASWKAIRFAEVKNPWFVLLETPRISLLSSGWRDRLGLLAIAGGSILAILLIVLVTMHRLVSTPLRRVGTVIDELGEGLFGMSVPYRTRTDEIGDVARGVVRLQNGGLEIARLREEHGEVEYLRAVARETELEAISSRFSASIESVAGSLRGVTAAVEGRSRQLAGAVDSATARLADLSLVSSSTRESMTEAARATATLLASIDAVGAQARLCGQAATSVERNTAATNVSLVDLKGTVGDIGSLVGMIGSIAAQIDLIALNATIEAARAGQAGRGFAVVAQEVKVLAGRTSVAAEAVAARIQALEKASAVTHASVFEMEAAFVGMSAISSTIALELDAQLSATGTIETLVDRALSGAEVTARSVADLTDLAGGVAKGTSDLHEQSDTLRLEVVTLNEEVVRFVEFLKAA